MKTETSFYLITKETEKFLFKKDFLVPNLIQPYLEKDYPFVLINYGDNKYTIQNWEYYFDDEITELRVYVVFLA
jgi:hypothetical protein